MTAYDDKDKMYLGLINLREEIQNLKNELQHLNWQNVEVLLLEEQDVLTFFKISKTTFYKYREKFKITPIEIFGRKLYSKLQIYNCLIDHILKLRA